MNRLDSGDDFVEIRSQRERAFLLFSGIAIAAVPGGGFGRGDFDLEIPLPPFPFKLHATAAGGVNHRAGNLASREAPQQRFRAGNRVGIHGRGLIRIPVFTVGSQRLDELQRFRQPFRRRLIRLEDG